MGIQKKLFFSQNLFFSFHSSLNNSNIIKSIFPISFLTILATDPCNNPCLTQSLSNLIYFLHYTKHSKKEGNKLLFLLGAGTGYQHTSISKQLLEMFSCKKNRKLQEGKMIYGFKVYIKDKQIHFVMVKKLLDNALLKIFAAYLLRVFSAALSWSYADACCYFFKPLICFTKKWNKRKKEKHDLFSLMIIKVSL